MVFAKAPQPGAVKTRLVPLLGADGAAALHCRLIAHALATARAAAPEKLELWCAPDAGHPFLQSAALAHGATVHVQDGNDLGERLAHALANGLRRAPYVLCIGADCPALTAQHLLNAAAALCAGNDAVFVPAEDGGYVLVGLARQAPQLFHDIAWGSSQVMAQTRAHLRALGLLWSELDPLWDIDRPEDYRRLEQSGLLDANPMA